MPPRFALRAGINTHARRPDSEIFRPSERGNSAWIAAVARGTPVAPLVQHAACGAQWPRGRSARTHRRSPTRCAPSACICRRYVTTNASSRPAPAACASCASTVHREPVPACATPVTEGLMIDTSPPDLEAARRGTLADARQPISGRGRRGPIPTSHSTRRSPRTAWTDELSGQAELRARRSVAPVHHGGHVALHPVRAMRAHLRRGAGAVRVARARPRRDDSHRAGRTRPAAQLVRELRRMRRHLPDRRPRRCDIRHARRADGMDPDRLPVLRHRLRAVGRHARRPHRVGEAA